VPCHVALTTPRGHEILRANFDRSPLFTGRIKGVGPRYCPSIEDKVHKFPSRESHQVFLEPEGSDSEEIYASGISTSMPAEVQLEFVRSIEGLEKAEIMRPGYAVEYDFVPPVQLRASLQAKRYPTLFLAGQINGTSGYEEAAAQGLMAGINAALLLRGEPPMILDRAEAYTGVMTIQDVHFSGRVSTSPQARQRGRAVNAPRQQTRAHCRRAVFKEPGAGRKSQGGDVPAREIACQS